MLGDGFHDIPPGKLAMVVTHLEMLHQAPARPVPSPVGVTLRQVRPDLTWYRDIFKRVGSLEWLWFSRLQMPDDALEEILNDRRVAFYTLACDGQDEALLELDFRTDGACELAYFGLTRALMGTGAGRFLMNSAIDLAWAKPITRFHVHTCTIDGPQALAFYRRSGFKAIRQQIEIADDPRLAGALPMTAGPHVPVLG